MPVNREVNPDSLMLRQADGQWQKFCGLLLWKLRGRGGEGVNISVADMEAMTKAFAPDIPAVLIHGHYDSMTFKLISQTEAHRLAVEEDKKTGHA